MSIAFAWAICGLVLWVGVILDDYFGSSLEKTPARLELDKRIELTDKMDINQYRQSFTLSVLMGPFSYF